MAVCTICRHPQKRMIEDGLLRNVPLRKLALQTGTSAGALHRHKQHLPARLVKAQEAQTVSDADRLLAKIEQLIDEAEGVADSARKEKNWSVVMSALREVRSCAELLAKLRGQLETGVKVGVAVAVNAPGAQEALSEAELDLVIAQHVRDATNNFDPGEIARLQALTQTIVPK